jgi:hypothetical protein
MQWLRLNGRKQALAKFRAKSAHVRELEAPQCYPTSAARGPRPVIVGECIGTHLYAEGSYCPLRWEPLSDRHCNGARYLTWDDGLVNLASSLAGRLTAYEPLPPAASAHPWRNPDPARVTWRTVVTKAMAALPLKCRGRRRRARRNGASARRSRGRTRTNSRTGKEYRRE